MTKLGKDGNVVKGQKVVEMTSAEALAFRAELLLEAAQKVDWDGDEVIIKIAEHLVALSNYFLSLDKSMLGSGELNIIRGINQTPNSTKETKNESNTKL